MSYHKDKDLLHGSLFKQIITFTLPLVVTNLVQMLYNAADVAIVGLSETEGAIGALGTTTALIHLMVAIFNGLAMGSGIIVARYIGEGNSQKIKLAVNTSIITSLFSGLICMAIGFFGCTPILRLMGDEGNILELASLYTKIYFLGVPFLSLTNYLISIFRAKGDTETPLKILLGTGLLNVIMNYVLVVFCHMDVDGVAIATSLSNFTSAIILTICLSKDDGVCHLSFSGLKADKKCFIEIMRNGIPAGIQGSMFSLSNVIIQSNIISVNNMLNPGKSFILDGNSAATSLESIASSVTCSITQTSTTFTSQHYGARMYDRLKKTVVYCILTGIILSVISELFFILARNPLLSVYNITNPQSKAAADTRLIYMLSLYFFYGIMEAEQGLLRGLDKSFQATIIAIAGIGVFRIVWIELFAKQNLTLEKIFVTYPLSWFLVAVVYFIIVVKSLKKLKTCFQ